MAELDHRIEKQPIVRVTSPVIVIPNSGDAEIEVTMNVNMTVQGIVYRAGDTSTDITRRLIITDAYGAEWFDEATLADNIATPLNALEASPDFDRFVINGKITLTIKPSSSANRSVAVNDYVDLLGV